MVTVSSLAICWKAVSKVNHGLIPYNESQYGALLQEIASLINVLNINLQPT